MKILLKRATSIVIVLVFVGMTKGMKQMCRFKRGQFNRLQETTESLESLDESDTEEMCTTIGKEVHCNDAYYMLSYLHLTNPQYFTYPEQVESLHKKINDEYPEWASKILATAFNAGQDDNEMKVPWLLFLYIKWIDVNVLAAREPGEVFLPVLQTAHYGMYNVMLCTMYENDCTMFDPETKEERKFAAYLGDVKLKKPTNNDFSENSDAVLELLKKHWPDLCVNSSLRCCQNEASTSDPVPGVQPLIEEHLTFDLLYLNDVFENAKGTTLLTEFGVFEDGNRLLRYLKDKIFEIKRGSTSFRQYVLSLVDFHEHVQRALKTMMLRIYYAFLEKLKMLNKDLRQEYFEQFLKPYNDWCDFLDLPKSFNGFYMLDLPRSWTTEDSVSERIIPGTQKWVIFTLRKNDEMSKVPLFNHESLYKINIDKSWLMVIVDEYMIPLDPRFNALEHLPKDHIQTTILCAEVFVGYIKKIFNDINFKAIQSLVMLGESKTIMQFQDYEQKYDVDVFLREDETHSIQVCSTHTIQYNTV